MATTPPPLRVAVIGGSIAGCGAAMAAHRAGCDVTVFERSTGDLADRGFGVALPTAVYELLGKQGYLDPDSPALTMHSRIWMTREKDSSDWREIWRQSPQLVTCNWGLLWKALRTNVPDGIYEAGTVVEAVRHTADDKAIVTVDGTEREFDLVIGADGYKSIVRSQVAAEATPAYAGYIAFRGVTEFDALSEVPETAKLLDDNGFTVLYDGGHMIVYPIPDVGSGRRVNWVLYFQPPYDLGVDAHDGAFAPGTVLEDLIQWSRKIAHEHLPAPIAPIVLGTSDDAMAVQPIFDLTLDSSVRTPYLLMGDAATVTRPHTGSGAFKALQDALALEQVLRDSTTPAEVTANFDAERNGPSNQIVELGRRIGRDQVENTPDWTTMDAASLSEYFAATWSGQKHYLHPDD